MPVALATLDILIRRSSISSVVVRNVSHRNVLERPRLKSTIQDLAVENEGAEYHRTQNPNPFLLKLETYVLKNEIS